MTGSNVGTEVLKRSLHHRLLDEFPEGGGVHGSEVGLLVVQFGRHETEPIDRLHSVDLGHLVADGRRERLLGSVLHDEVGIALPIASSVLAFMEEASIPTAVTKVRPIIKAEAVTKPSGAGCAARSPRPSVRPGRRRPG